MFSKSRINEPGPKKAATPEPAQRAPEQPMYRAPAADTGSSSGAPQATKAKPAASVLSSDLTITGNLKTTGDVVVEGMVDGDIRAHLLTVGDSATIRGEIVADDIVINGRVIGRVRGLKVRLTSSARVEGDIIHKTIAIESGAHFEGSVQRQDDPLATNARVQQQQQQQPAAYAPAPQPAPAPAPQPRPEPSAAVRAAAESKKAADEAAKK
ncbi:bactofilin family protein [Roseicitreum antarcticum]|uniref:Protein CcmA, bactofilin family n=1 Tax=Roseicitreum antarcticum TaxID=564137 RepID=A0A1H2ZWQ5_9RHOB|nr:polymer-forming cytoskeletal protein [Roseicitreum antarcticum]SDX21950.1 protein CcmA, bactofilin family [Roseicitreum antarcticum]